MAIVTLTVLKGYFNDGDVPTEANYIDLIDTLSQMADLSELGDVELIGTMELTGDGEIVAGGGAVKLDQNAVVSPSVEVAVVSGDPDIIFDIGGSDQFTLGVDDSDDDKFKINSGGAIADPSSFELDSSGNVEIAGKMKSGVVYDSGQAKPANTSAVMSAVAATITGCAVSSIEVPAGGRVLINWIFEGSSSSPDYGYHLYIFRGGTNLRVQNDQARYVGGAQVRVPYSGTLIDTPSAGTYDYTLKWAGAGSTGHTCYARNIIFNVVVLGG
jgi:hypothetical protein